MSGPSSMGHQFGMPGMPVQQQFVPAFASGAAPQAATVAPPLLVGQRQPLPKQLTAAIKSCTSLERLAQLFAAHQAVLNPIHIAAMITKLPKLDSSVHNAAMATGADLPWILSTASVQQVQLRQLLQQLLLRLKAQGCGEYSPRGVANIVWALAKLQCAPDPELRQMLLDKFCSQLPTAVPQDVSNVLWGVAKLTKERSAVVTNVTNTNMLGSAPAVLQPLGLAGAGGSLSSPSNSSSPSLAGSAISQQIWGLMGPGSLGSGTYDAAAAALVAVPLLAQDQVRLLLQHLCQQLHIASVQTISNSLWAVVVLQQEHQWCMCNCLQEVQMLLSAFCRQPHQALPGHIQPVIRCMAQLATTCSNHAGDSWIKWQPPLLKQLLDHLCNQREHMEMHHVSSVLRDVAQVVCLHLLLTKQLWKKQQQQDGEACGLSSSQSAAVSSGSSSPTQLASQRIGGMSTAPYSLNMISAAEEAEEVLARLAASGGPQDASSTVVALAMLQPQLKQLELQHGVAGLCSMLPPAALPHLAEEDGQRLLAAASSLPSSSPTAAARSDVSAMTASTASQLQMMLATGQCLTNHMPPAPLGTPLAAAESSSADNSSGDNAVLNASEGGSVVVTAADAACPAALDVGAGAAAGQLTSATQQRMLLAEGASKEGVGSSNIQQHDGSNGAAAVSSCTTEGCTAGGCPGGAGCDQAQQQQRRLQKEVAAGLAGGSSGSSSNTPGLPGGNLQQQQLIQPPSALGEASISPAVNTIETHSLGLGAGGSVPDDLASTGIDSQEEAAARQLTHNIANADSVYQLAEIFSAHFVVMDMIHITACITRLSKVLGSAPTAASQAAAASLLPMLGAKLLQVLPNANARGIANILWGYGRLRNLPQSELLPELLEAFLQQLPNAACRDSAVVLWSLARLTEGQGLAAIGVTPDLLVRLGRAVLEQLAAAAAAASTESATGQVHQPQQQPHGGETAGSSATKLPNMSAAQVGDSAAAPSSRDISNSLMALTRLGFMPETVEGAATATSGAATGGTAAATSAAASELLPSLSAAHQAGAAAGLLQGLSVQDRAAAAAPGIQQLGSEQHPAASGASSAEQSAKSQAAADASQQPKQVKLTLSVSPIQIIVRFLLHHAPTAKTLDLQEAATALKQLGLMELHSQVAAAISSPQFSSQVGHAGSHHGSADGHSGGSSSMQYIHHMAAGVGGGGSPMMSGGLHGHSGRGGVGQMLAPSGPGSTPGRSAVSFASAPSAVLARSHHGHQQHAPGHQPQAPAVSMPTNLNLSGTQLAGLLQQQRRQQPLHMSGPAYGAGWLPGNTPQGISHQQQQLGSTGSRTACMLTPGGSTGSIPSQQQLPIGGVMYMPGGGTAVRQMPGQQVMAYSAADVADSQSRIPTYQGGGYMSSREAFAQHGLYGHQHGMQQQQQQRRPIPQHQQWQQQPQQPVPPRRLSGAQQGDLLPRQLQQPGYTSMAVQQGDMQYVFVPQQSQQRQQQQGGYFLQRQQQQQQRADLMLMQQALQDQGFYEQQQPGQQMLMVPASMGAATGLVNLGQPGMSLAGQQQQGLGGCDMMSMNSAAVAMNEPWPGQQQQQQQSQQLVRMLPQLQAAAAGTGNTGRLPGQFVAAGQSTGGDMQFQVSGSMLMPADYAQADFAGQQQQQLQMYNFVPGAGQYQQQQQPPRLDNPGMFLPPQQQQMDTLQAAQMPAAMFSMGQQGMAGRVPPQQDQVLIDPATGYAFNPAQLQP